jgi:predicted DNA-binding transcriptional regulator YafY
VTPAVSFCGTLQKTDAEGKTMRADRLINLVLLLQNRGTATAAELADELGVSRRTIYRDIEALGVIGVPIYADYGVTGGYHLLEDYGGELNGLTRDERRSLLMLTVPDALTELEIGQKLKTALLKLYASMTTPQQQRVLLDWAWWGHSPAPHLRALYEAVQSDYQVFIRYRLWGHLDIERTIDPYGLIFKAGVWYVIAASGGRIQHMRISNLTAVTVTSTRFTRPADFDLDSCWKAICAKAEAQRPEFEIVLRAAPTLLRFWTQPYSIVAAGDDGWATLRLCVEDFDAALKLILPLGGAAEIIAPEALRLTVQDYAAQILRRYGHDAPAITRPSSPSRS